MPGLVHLISTLSRC